MIDQFEAYVAMNLPQCESFHPHYNEALQSMILAGGKRFRPMLLLHVVKAFAPMLIESALPVAMALEVMHTYSLIHDDLPAMDDADLRRNTVTLHRRFDETTAILAGDALNTLAFELIADAPLRDDVIVKLVKILAQDSGYNGMVHGQALDCFFENQKLEVSDVRFLHLHKTGKLIAASLKMGALVCVRDDLANSLYDFGLDLGLLFQIQDDILDALLSNSEAGKPTQHDGEKNSFVTLLGLDEAIREADTLAERTLSELLGFETPLQEELNRLLGNYLRRHNIKEKHE